MTKRIILAALLGGLAVFVWEFVAHDMLPLGEAGLKAMDHEDAVVAALKDNVMQPGFYFFPAPATTPGMSKADQEAAMRQQEEKWRTGPSGMLVFHPNGSNTPFARQLITQFVADVLAMLLAALLLTQATAVTGFGTRVLFVTALGLFPTLAAELPYWNWYGFPGTYTLAQFTVHLVGFFVGGLVVASFVRPSARQRAAVAVAA